MYRGRLRNKIFLALVLVGIVPLVFLGVLSVYSLNLFHEADVRSIEDNLLNQKIVEIGEAFDRVIGTLELTVAFEQVSDIELSQQHFLLEQFLQEIPALEEISFISITGQETSVYSKAGFAADDELADHSLNKSFQLALTGKNYLSPVYFTLSGPAMSIATPVKNRNGIVISVLSGKINLQELQKIIRRSYLGETGYLYLLDETGILVAHSKEDRLAGIGFDRVGQADDTRYNSHWGEPVVASRKAVGKLDLILVAEWPTREADAVVNTVRNQMLMFSVLVLAIALVASVFLTLRIVRPIRMLEKGTEAVAEGKFDQPISIKTHDEIEELGIAFNKMMEGLKRFEELKEEFVFVAAHELRTPVTAIKGYLSMVMEGDAGQVSAEAREMLGQVTIANQRLIQLVEDLLQVARSEAGRLTIEVAAVDAAGPVQDVLKELAPLAAEKGIKFVYEPAQGLPKIMADSARLKEVLVNLIGNAIKYTIGQGTVTVSHTISDGSLVTHITDTGIGIPPEAQKKLFEKFYRVQSKEAAGITGTGLGLFIVKQIVEKMNGKIWVASEKGKGSTFSFSLKTA